MQFLQQTKEASSVYQGLIYDAVLEGVSVASPYATLASEAALDAYNTNLAPIVDAKVKPIYKEHVEEHVETAKVKAKEFYEETKPAAVELWEKLRTEAKNLRLSVASMVQEGAKVTREKYKSETPGEGIDGVLNVMEVSKNRGERTYFGKTDLP